MLKIGNHNLSFSGESVQEDMTLAVFNAAYTGVNNVSLAASINNYNMGEEAKEIVLNDLYNFYSEVLYAISSINNMSQSETNSVEGESTMPNSNDSVEKEMSEGEV